MRESTHRWHPQLVSLALEGRPEALRSLVETLTPVVQARVARVLHKRAASSRGRTLRQEVEDFVQEIFLSLLDDGGRALRAWDPQRGLSLENFVGYVAERQTYSILRTARRSPWTEDPTLAEEMEGPSGPAPDLIAALETSQLLDVVLERMQERLSPLGMALFDRLFVDQLPVADVCSDLKMSRDAVYAWQSRLGKLLRSIAQEVLSEAEPGGAR